jgi:hypothetical protein
LLEDLQDGRGRADGGFADQPRHLLGPDHVAQDAEWLLASDLAQNSNPLVAGARPRQKRQPAITTAGDEIEVAWPVIAFQPFGQGSKMPSPKTAPPFETPEGGGTLVALSRFDDSAVSSQGGYHRA